MKEQHLQDYLNRYFISRDELERKLEVDSHELNELINCGFIPSWSYKVEDGFVRSHIFGQSLAPSCDNGEYFSPYAVDWYYYHLEHFADYKTVDGLKSKLHLHFIQAFVAEAHTSESFQVTFPELLEDFNLLQEMANNTWQHYMKGTFGVCIRKPSSIAHLIEKQVAAAALSKVTNNGKKFDYDAEELVVLHRCIREYNKVAMPFSPVDYEKSSRKRLVDNVVKKL